MDKEKTKKILVLTADAGFGHRSAATAVAEALDEVYSSECHVEVVNALDDRRAPALLRDAQTDYDRIVREMPDLYKLPYKLTDAPIPTTILESAFTVMLYQVIKDLIKRYRPNAIVSTYPLYLPAIQAVQQVRGWSIPWLTVVTDLATVHRLWFNSGTDLCLVPTQPVQHLALEAGLPAAKIAITGIPIHPKFIRETRSAAEIRNALGWHPEMPTVLIVGSKRVKNLEGVIDILNHSGLSMQKVIVTGGDDELYERLQHEERHGVTHLYNFVKNMPDMMHAADCIVCKAGGLTVTEALACGLPLMLIDVTPGQEEGNADYVVSNGAGERTASAVDALKGLYHWLDDGQKLLKERSAAARRVGTPRSAYTVAELAWNAANAEPDKTRKLFPMRPHFQELLQRFGISDSASAEDAVS